MKNSLKAAFLHTLPVLAGYLFLGFAFGLLMRTKGYPFWLPVVMSILIYSGALEFAAVPMLIAPFDPFGTFIIGITLSARHIFYGIPMLEKFQNIAKAKFMLIFGLTDETFSILTTETAPEGIEATDYYLAVTLLDYSYWVTGTLFGAVTGSNLPFDITGLDFALTALFIVLFVEQISHKEGLYSGVAGLAASAAVLILFGSHYFVVISMAVIAALLIVGKKVIRRE